LLRAQTAAAGTDMHLAKPTRPLLRALTSPTGTDWAAP
jgi:hypothetical protein